MADETLQTFEELLEEAVKEVQKNILDRVKRTYFKEPSAHDIRYHVGPDGKRHLPNGVPIELSLNQAEPESIDDRMRRLIRSEKLQDELKNVGMETFEDADDFDVDEDPIFRSPYEMEEDFDPAPELQPRQEPPAPVEAEVPPSPSPEPETETPAPTPLKKAPKAK